MFIRFTNYSRGYGASVPSEVTVVRDMDTRSGRDCFTYLPYTPAKYAEVQIALARLREAEAFLMACDEEAQPALAEDTEEEAPTTEPVYSA